MKLISLDGRIGKDGAEVKYTKGGKPYVKFSVANNSFVAGQDKTEWFDITSYDPYVIENRVKYLTKGTYVIITGSDNVEVNVRDGKIWVNRYVTATNIDTPSFKKKEDEGNVVGTAPSASDNISTFTGETPSIMTEKTVSTSPSVESIPSPQPSYSTVGDFQSNIDDDGDLPF